MFRVHFSFKKNAGMTIKIFGRVGGVKLPGFIFAAFDFDLGMPQ